MIAVVNTPLSTGTPSNLRFAGKSQLNGCELYDRKIQKMARKTRAQERTDDYGKWSLKRSYVCCTRYRSRSWGNYPRRYSDRTNSRFCSSEYHGNWFAWSNFILWTIPECWSRLGSSSYSNSLDCWIRNVLQERIEGKTNYWAGNRPPKLILWAGVFA